MQGIDSIRLITTREAAEILKFHPGTLRRWRIQGRHLRYYALGAKGVRYDERDVMDFLASGMHELERGRA